MVGLPAVVCGTRPASAQTVRLVHMSDIHAARVKSNPAPRFPGDPLRNDLVHSLEILGRAVEHINTRLRPELVVITGDLVDRGNDLESLKKVKTRLDRLTCPYYPVIGDHDRRKIYEQVFPGKLDYSFEHGNGRRSGPFAPGAPRANAAGSRLAQTISCTKEDREAKRCRVPWPQGPGGRVRGVHPACTRIQGKPSL